MVVKGNSLDSEKFSGLEAHLEPGRGHRVGAQAIVIEREEDGSESDHRRCESGLETDRQVDDVRAQPLGDGLATDLRLTLTMTGTVTEMSCSVRFELPMMSMRNATRSTNWVVKPIP